MSETVKHKLPSYGDYYDCGLPDTDGIKRSGKFIRFGKYIQTEINSHYAFLKKELPAEIIDEMQEIDSFIYKTHTVTAAPYSSDVLFDSKQRILNGKEYKFYSDDIEWYVLDENDECATLICCCVIASRRFDEKNCDYKTSELRKWLNGEFYNEAFDEIHKKSILPQNGDNVSLLTLEDLNTDKGRWFLHCRFPSPTEYARATGVNCEQVDNIFRFRKDCASWWWLKNSKNGSVCCYDFIKDDGIFENHKALLRAIENNIIYKSPTDLQGGVVPVIKIKLNSEKNSRNKFQESADIIKIERPDNINEFIEYRCPCGQGKICSEAAWGFGDYVAWIECDRCAEKYNIYTGQGHLWELKEIIKKTDSK